MARQKPMPPAEDVNRKATEAENEAAEQAAQAAPPARPPAEGKGGDRLFIADLQHMTIKELRDTAKKENISEYSSLNKQDLLFKILKERCSKNGLMYGEGVLEVLPDGFGFLRSPDYNYFELDPPEAVDAVLDLCRQRGVTIAVTIHDLQPMFSDPVEFRKGIERTTGAASYVFTLTPGARDALVRDFALDVSHLRVVPHGNVLDLSSPYWEQTHHSARCITFGVYGAIRPNRGVAELLRVWRGFAAGRDVRLRLLLRATADRLSQDEMEEVEALLAMVPEASLDRLTLGWVRPTDGQIVEFLRGCDVVILPYRWGSHSGQLELGFDLNLTIVAPDIGFYREQYEPKAGLVQEPVWFSWTPRSHQLDLVAALQDAEQRARWRGGLEMSGLRAFRIAERELIRAEHLRCYRGRPT